MRQKRALILDDYNTAIDGGFTLSDLKVGVPKVREEYEDVPGMDGSLDFTEAVAGRPIYGMRQITAKLECSRGKISDRQDIFDIFVSRFHGRKVRLRVPDDPQKYFVGRISVSEANNIIPYGWIELDASCEPWRYSDVPCICELPIRSLEENELVGAEITLMDGSTGTLPVCFAGSAANFPAATFSGARGTFAVWEISLEANTDYWICGKITEGQGYWSASTSPDDSNGCKGAIRTGSDGKIYLRLTKYSALAIRLSNLFVTKTDNMQPLTVGAAPAIATLRFIGDNSGSISVSIGTNTTTYSNNGSLEVVLEPGVCPAICYAPAGTAAPILSWTRGDL